MLDLWFFSSNINTITHLRSSPIELLEYRNRNKNKNETYYRSERNLFLTIWIYFNYLNLFLTIWIYFYPFLSIGIGIYFYRFEYISIYLNLFIVPLVLSEWGIWKTSDPTEIILTNIRPILVEYQTNIIQASD